MSLPTLDHTISESTPQLSIYERSLRHLRGIGLRNLDIPVSNDVTSLPWLKCCIFENVPVQQQSVSNQVPQVKALLDVVGSLIKNEKSKGNKSERCTLQSPPPSLGSHVATLLQSHPTPVLRDLLDSVGWRGLAWTPDGVDLQPLSTGLAKIIKGAQSGRADGATEDRLLFETNIAQWTVNPWWSGMEMFAKFRSLTNKSELGVHVMEVDESGTTLRTLLYQTFALSQLEWVARERHELPVLTTNALLVQLIDGFYITTATLAGATAPPPPPLRSLRSSLSSSYMAKRYSLAMSGQIMQSILNKSQQKESVKLTVVTMLSARLHRARSARQELLHRRQELRDGLRGKHSHLFEHLDRAQLMAHLVSCHRTMESEITRGREAINTETQALATKRSQLVNRIEVLSALRKSLLDRELSLDETRKALQRESRQLQDAHALMWQRQWRMVRGLSIVYPIEEDSRGEKSATATQTHSTLSIRRCSLPSVRTFKHMHAFPTELQEQFAAATGHITHICNLLSRYFQTPLQHPVKFLASRSIIHANRLPSSLDFPLFERGVDRIMFNIGLYLLTTNVEQLAKTLDVTLQHSEQGMLACLHEIFNFTGSRESYARQRQMRRVSSGSRSVPRPIRHEASAASNEIALDELEASETESGSEGVMVELAGSLGSPADIRAIVR